MERKHRGLVIILAIAVCFCLLITALGSFFAVADGLCEQNAHIVPSYKKIDLTPLIDKEEWTEEDYETIYRQTGLTKAGADSVPRRELSAFQHALFFEGEAYHEYITPITPHDRLTDSEGEDFTAPMVPLETGDVIVSSTTHLFGWRHGHAALVVNGSAGTLLEAVAIGIDSKTSNGGSIWFKESANFIVLRLKDADRAVRTKIAEDAVQELKGIPYNIFLGFLMPKDQCKNGRTPSATNCAHLVWQAFMNAGYDLDSTGGPLVTPKDISHSLYLEVVQVYGFDLDKLWE